MHEFRVKMGENGRILIPADCRQQLHLNPGEELILRIEDEELRLYSVHHALKKAQALVKSYAKNRNLVNELKEMRRKEAKRE